jgi:acetyl esterase/lipase
VLRLGRRSVLAGLAGFAPALLGSCAPASGRPAIVETPGVAYGPHPRQVYDLYEPDAPADVPLVVFLHGGGWTSGSPGLYRYLGRALALEGWRAALPAYRLSPEVAFPAFVADAALALAALRNRFDRAPVFLMGHSAGAHIGALIALDERFLARHGLVPCGTLAGFIGLAGPYDFLPLPWPSLRPIFPEATRAESQPVAFAGGPRPPALLAHGLGDRTVAPRNSRRLAAALDAAGNRVTLRLYEDAGHLDVVTAFSALLRGRAPVLGDLRTFIRAESGAGYPGCPASR